MSQLLRLRMVIVAVAMFVVTMVASTVFDRWVWSLVVAVVVPTAVALVVRPLPFVVRLVGGFVGVLASTAAIVAIEQGTLTDFGHALVSGAQRLLTTEWPSPDRPDLIGAVGLYLAIATALSASIAGRRRWHLLPMGPVVIAFVTSIGLSAPQGARMVSLIPLAVLGACFAALRPDTSLADRWSTLRGERRLVPLLLIAGLIAGAVSLPMSLSVRADPRRSDPAEQSATLIDPIESTLALRELNPSVDLHQITLLGNGNDSPTVLPGRWRTSALGNYDGQRWTPALTLRPIGGRLAPDARGQLDAEVTFLDDDLQLVPFPGAPITVGAAVVTDADRTVVLLEDRREADDPVVISAQIAPTLVDAELRGIATRPVDDSVSSLTEFAEVLAGNGTVVEQLRQMEREMRQWTLARNAPGSGLQRALIERFLRDTERGTAEQFVTSYVLLARSLGIDARVATGFIVPPAPAGDAVVLTSLDAQIWPEVRIVGGGWTALDPVPEDESSDLAPPPEQPAVQTPAAVQPPVAPPAEATNDADVDDQVVDNQTATTLSSIRIWAQRIGIGTAGLLLPLLLVVGLILGVKRRRRRRRLMAAGAAARVSGAWAVATDRLVDAGLVIAPSATNGDIAVAGLPLAAGAERELRRLATLSSAVTFGTPARPDLLAEDAASCLGHVEEKMAGGRTRTQRLRWVLSLRSLRRSTRSPVAN